MNVNSDGKLKVNVNRFENSNVWNAENRNRMVALKLAVSPVYFLSSGSFLSRPFLQPLNILPISLRLSAISSYCLWEINFASQLMEIKNLIVSKTKIHFDIFSFLFALSVK